MKLKTQLIIYYLLATVFSILIVGTVMVNVVKYSGIKTVERQLIKKIKIAEKYIVQTVFLNNKSLEDLNQTTIDRLIENLNMGLEKVRIYGERKQLIGTSKNFKENKYLEEKRSELFKNAKNGQNTYFIDGDIIHFMSPVIAGKNIIGYIEVEYEMAFLDAILENVIKILLAGLILLIILIIILSLIIATKVVKPINKLIDLTGEFANRNFTTIPEGRKDEIGQLAERFNIMGKNLYEYIEKQKIFVANVSFELNSLHIFQRFNSMKLKHAIIPKEEEILNE